METLIARTAATLRLNLILSAGVLTGKKPDPWTVPVPNSKNAEIALKRILNTRKGAGVMIKADLLVEFDPTAYIENGETITIYTIYNRFLD